MLSLIEPLADWIDARWPEAVPFVAGLGTSFLGLGALVILTVGLAPAKLVILMPIWLCICAASGGYSLWQKRREQSSLTLPLLTLALAGILALAGVAGQYLIEKVYFQPQIRPVFFSLALAAAVFGSALGGWLRLKYEQVSNRQ
jgi:uncharacterized membrane protein YfcA